MHLPSIANILFFTTTATALLIPRAVTFHAAALDIRGDLENINSQVTSLTSTVQSWSGGDLAGALPIQQAASGLSSTLTSSQSSISGSPTLSDDEAQAIIDYINSTLEPNIRAAVDALKGKKSAFDGVGATGLVKSSLDGLKTNADGLGSTLLSKAPQGKMQAGQEVLGKIDKDLDDAVGAFS